MKISIVDIDKLSLLYKLWENQVDASFFKINGKTNPGFRISDDEHREKALSAIEKGYIDYFFGRAIKNDLSRDEICSSAYDRDAGEGTLLAIVCELKKER